MGLGTPGISDSRSAVFHCALNAIFALGCQLAGTEISIQNRELLSQTFFLRSKALLHVDILDHGGIAIVQTLLIVAQYLQSTSFPSRCWTGLGLACRIGRGLGLHVEERHKQREPHNFEIRRRVWYGCVTLDMSVSSLSSMFIANESKCSEYDSRAADDDSLPPYHSHAFTYRNR